MHWCRFRVKRKWHQYVPNDAITLPLRAPMPVSLPRFFTVACVSHSLVITVECIPIGAWRFLQTSLKDLSRCTGNFQKTFKGNTKLPLFIWAFNSPTRPVTNLTPLCLTHISCEITKGDLLKALLLAESIFIMYSIEFRANCSQPFNPELIRWQCMNFGSMRPLCGSFLVCFCRWSHSWGKIQCWPFVMTCLEAFVLWG